MEHSIFNRIEEKKSVDFGDILSKSIELFKKVWVEALKHAVVTILIIIPFMLLMYMPFFPMIMESVANESSYDPSTALNNHFSGLFMGGWIFVVFLIALVIQPLALSIQGNFFKVCKKYDLDEDVPTDRYFHLLKNHFGKLLLLTLASMGIAMVAALLCYLPLLYAIVPLQLLLPIFVFNESLSISEIIKAAFKLGNNYWLTVFGLIIVSGILSSVGIILCFIGVLVTSFFQYIVIYYFYKESIGFYENSGITGA